jgi:hypothetical protein
VQLLAALFQPVGTYQVSSSIAEANGFGSAEHAEIAVSLEFMLQGIGADFDHDGVIEKTQSGNVIGYEVLWLRKISQSFQHP